MARFENRHFASAQARRTISVDQEVIRLEPGDIIADRYEVIEQLELGDLGPACRVRDRHEEGAERTLRFISPAALANDAVREPFRAGIEMAVKLRHERIVQVYGLEEDPEWDILFVVMEAIEGTSLDQVLTEHKGPVPHDKTLNITRQLCDALAYAHMHTAHGCLTPQSIFVSEDGSVKLCDFGMAALAAPSERGPAHITPDMAYYLPPERVLRESSPDAQADVYSLGVILYHMLTGVIPVGSFEPPSHVVPQIPANLDEVVAKCLKPSPASRYASARDVARALDAPPAPSGSGSGRRIALVAAVVVVVGLIISVAGGFWTPFGAPDGDPGTTTPTTSDPIAQGPDALEPGPEIVRPEGVAPDSAEVLLAEPAEAAPGEARPIAAPLVGAVTPVAAARKAAARAQTAAHIAKAGEHALDIFYPALSMMTEAEEMARAKNDAGAIAKFEEAKTIFEEAERMARQAGRHETELADAESALAKAKAEADADGAAAIAADEYAKAQQTERAAQAAEERLEKTRLTRSAADQFRAAAAAAAGRRTAETANAKTAAEAARQEAETAVVRRHAADRLAEADRVMAEAQKTVDAAAAIALYEKAAAQCQEAQRVSAEKQTEAKAAMERILESALAVRKDVRDDERAFAEDNVKAGDEAWKKAEASRGAQNFVEAMPWYDIARSRYSEAIRVTSEQKPEGAVVVALEGEADFKSINEAIAAAEPGARIRVMPGVYTEGVVLDKRVTLIAANEDGEVRIQTTDANCITMRTDEATVQGFALFCKAPADAQKGGVYVPQGRLTLESCNIQSDSLACVQVGGGSSRVFIRKCKIHDSAKANGIRFVDGASGTVEDSQIYGNAAAGIALTDGARPLIRGCAVYGGYATGISIWNKAKGTIEDCDIHGNALAGIQVYAGADPTIQNCTIHDGKGPGLLVFKEGRGRIDECQIHSNAKTGVEVNEGGNPTLRNCSIFDGKASGVIVWNQGRGTFENCKIYSNAGSGAKLALVANPTFWQCVITQNAEHGVTADKTSSGVIEQCDLRKNTQGALQIEKGSKLIQRNNQE
jgi:parallel beta-helix repeat protein